MRRLRHRPSIFYGWHIAAVIFSTGFARAGFVGPLFGIFLKPMTEEFGWSRSAMTGAVTIGTIGAALVGVLAGRALDRYGPRVMFTLAGTAVALSYIGLSTVETLVMFYIYYVIGRAVTQSALGESMLGAVVSKWFVRRRGLAVSLAGMGGPLGGLVLAIGLQMVIHVLDWRFAWLSLGGVGLILMIVPPGLILRRTPEDIGLLPDGDKLSKSLSLTPITDQSGKLQPKEEYNWTLAEARRTVTFWLLMVVSALGALASTAINFHMVPHFTDVGIAPLMAATALGLFGLINALSLPFWGYLADRVHVRRVLLLALAVQLVGVFLILNVHTEVMVYSSAMIYGIGFGGFMTVLSITWATYFGRKHLGVIRGWELSFRLWGNALGPLLAALIFDATQRYRAAFTISAVMLSVNIVLVFFARNPKYGSGRG
jgi:OFA family oxalate/formate antiporter-like MFS transporter